MADLATTPSQALEGLSDRQRAVLEAARRQNNRQQPVSYDSIKLKDSEKKVLDVDGKPLPRGEYYIESYDPASKSKTYRCIGKNPEIVILHRCYTYSWYKEGEGLMAWTSDIQSLDESGYVTLFAKQDGKMTVAFEGRYKPDFKNLIDAKYTSRSTDGKTEKLLKFQTLLYVMFEGVVYRMFVTNASAAGIPMGEKGPDFKNPQPGSLIEFIEKTTRGTEMAGSLPEWVCRLGATFRDEMEQPFYIRTFENVGPNPELGKALDELDKLSQAVKSADATHRAAQERTAIASLKPAADALDEDVLDVPAVSYQPEIKVEDLPF